MRWGGDDVVPLIRGFACLLSSRNGADGLAFRLVGVAHRGPGHGSDNINGGPGPHWLKRNSKWRLHADGDTPMTMDALSLFGLTAVTAMLIFYDEFARRGFLETERPDWFTMQNALFDLIDPAWAANLTATAKPSTVDAVPEK